MKTKRDPKKPSKDVCELIGAIMGDGNIYERGGWVELTGNVYDDRDYFQNRLRGIILKELDYDTHFYFRKDTTIRARVYSKSFVGYLKGLGIPTGAGKSRTVTIPKCIAGDWGLARRCVRGMFDTDSSVYFDRRPAYKEYYPRIDLHINNMSLIKQLAHILSSEGFNPRISFKKSSLYLNGKKELGLFLKKVGFSNPKHLIRITTLSS